jgi:hypothetical protein
MVTGGQVIAKYHVYNLLNNEITLPIIALNFTNALITNE